MRYYSDGGNSFLSILTEAKKPSKKKPKEESEDYTEDVETDDTSDSAEDEPDVDEGEDYTDDNEIDDDTTDNNDTEEESDDYTVDEGEDYTDDELTDDTDNNDDIENDESEQSVNDDSDDSSEEEPTEEDADEATKKKYLLKDYINLFYGIKNSISKLSASDKTNMIVNTVIVQINQNLAKINKYLFEYITNLYGKTDYINNLYRYNYFLEMYRLNVEMLKKVDVYLSKEQTNI